MATDMDMDIDIDMGLMEEDYPQEEIMIADALPTVSGDSLCLRCVHVLK